jgi:DNA polymerase V
MSLSVNTNTTGFGSPAETYVSKRLDLNELIPKDLVTTFYFRYEGENKFDVRKGDILVIDKSVEPEEGDLVISITDKFILEKFEYNANQKIWGTITWILNQRKK